MVATIEFETKKKRKNMQCEYILLAVGAKQLGLIKSEFR